MINTKKPQLVEKKLRNFYINKFKLNNVNKQPEIINNVNNINNVIKSWFIYLLKYILDFIKLYYGFALLIGLIIILLYIRYIEVNKRKEKIKKIISNYKNEDDDSSEYNNY